jgi:hypothetical protein
VGALRVGCCSHQDQQQHQQPVDCPAAAPAVLLGLSLLLVLNGLCAVCVSCKALLGCCEVAVLLG